MPSLDRKKSRWRKALLRTLQKAGADLGDIPEERILETIREYRSGRKKPKTIAVAQSKDKSPETG